MRVLAATLVVLLVAEQLLFLFARDLVEQFAFGTWPTMLYFIFIVASTLRLDFLLPAFTGIVAAAGYLGIATWFSLFKE